MALGGLSWGGIGVLARWCRLLVRCGLPGAPGRGGRRHIEFGVGDSNGRLLASACGEGAGAGSADASAERTEEADEFDVCRRTDRVEDGGDAAGTASWGVAAMHAAGCDTLATVGAVLGLDAGADASASF